ncbi:MAG: response regulator [Bacteroidetes bacterium]|nr:response regulator [Bacteroidota bacterium]MCW5893982.1 response regulator [Bacteroidota bacterium]
MKVFIVDESSLFVARFSEAINKIEGVELVGKANSAIEAIEALERMQPDVVVLDIRLRIGTGFDVLRMVKRDIDTSTIAIVMTNYPYEQYRRVSTKMGADYFFHKTTQFTDLVSLLKDLKTNRFAPEISERFAATV